MTQLVIELPFPSNKLSPNGRFHWAVVAKAKKEARSTAYYLTKEVLKGSECVVTHGYVAVSLEFQPPSRRSYDLDGLLSRSKAYLDGIADAIGIDDKHFRPTLIMGEPVKGGRVVVKIG